MKSTSSPQITEILQRMYDKFARLPLGGKEVTAVYRRNEVGKFQQAGPEFQGKSSPERILRTTKKLAREQNFDLDKAYADEIRAFMKKNKIGIDCSGFVYRMLNFLVEELGLGSLESNAGFEHIGRTNVAKLTSDEFSVPIKDFKDVKPGDLIKLNSGEDILHCLIVLDNQNGTITYAHSSGATKINGVHQDKIVNGNFPDDLQVFSYDPKKGDGIRRLKIFA